MEAPWYYYVLLLPMLGGVHLHSGRPGRPDRPGNHAMAAQTPQTGPHRGRGRYHPIRDFPHLVGHFRPQRQRFNARLVQRHSLADALRRGTASAELVAEHGPSGAGAAALGSGAPVPGCSHLQRVVPAADRHLVRPESLPGGLQPLVRNALVARTRSSVLDGRAHHADRPHSATDAAASDQRPPALPPRPGAVVAVPHFLRPFWDSTSRTSAVSRTNSSTSDGRTWSAF